ncbi:hypothetical protein MAR_002119 [Mya arenaria]|uniref:Uncharacterized protein n=1 Tax=Mya arenaria TaxID=6604 RepID=A0ABY7FH67_MYAAR|nr:hypothetical protein MAR_002119 [Mya arenaria]
MEGQKHFSYKRKPENVRVLSNTSLERDRTSSQYYSSNNAKGKQHCSTENSFFPSTFYRFEKLRALTFPIHCRHCGTEESYYPFYSIQNCSTVGSYFPFTVYSIVVLMARYEGSYFPFTLYSTVALSAPLQYCGCVLPLDIERYCRTEGPQHCSTENSFFPSTFYRFEKLRALTFPIHCRHCGTEESYYPFYSIQNCSTVGSYFPFTVYSIVVLMARYEGSYFPFTLYSTVALSALPKQIFKGTLTDELIGELNSNKKKSSSSEMCPSPQISLYLDQMSKCSCA